MRRHGIRLPALWHLSLWLVSLVAVSLVAVCLGPGPAEADERVPAVHSARTPIKASTAQIKGELELVAALPCPDGGYLISATATGRVSLQRQDGAWLELDAVGESDALLLRFEPTGRVAWALRGRGPAGERGGPLAQLEGGGIAWSGRLGLDLTLESFAPDSDRPKVTARLVSGQVKYPEYAMSSFVLRLSPAGLLGSRTTLRHVLVNRLEPTAEGVVVLGEVNYRAAVIPARGRSLTVDLACRGRDQGLLASLDADCKAIWAAQISGMSTRLDVAAVSSGSIYVGGVFKGEGHLLGPVGKVSVAYASQGQIRRGCVRRRVSDLFLARLDLATGELRWSGQLKGHGPEGLWSLRCFGDRLYLAGWQQGALTYRRGAETFSTFESPTGGFLLSVDRRGRGHVWEGFPVPGGLQGVRVLGPNRVALYGTTSDTLTLGGRALPFRGGEDAYLAELQLAPLRLGRVVGLRTKARGVALLPLLGRNLRLIGSHDEQVVVGGKLTR